MRKSKIIATIFAALLPNFVFAALPSNHAPIGVMADHTHKKGEFMVSIRHMDMKMDKLYDGDSKISTSDVTGSMMNPVSMNMTMEMFGLMYGLSDNQTIMIMANYLDNDMVMKNAMSGNISRMTSHGVGDTKLTLLQDISSIYPFGNRAQINFGLSIPTGSIDETGTNDIRLPYKMQLGSGTFDPNISLTNHGDLGLFKYGYQINATFRLGRNSEDYSKGEQYKFTYFGARDINENISISNRINYELNTEYDGSDSKIEDVAMSSITRDASKQSGEIIEYSFGVNYLSSNNSRVGFEYNIPIYQNLDGPQLGKGQSFTIALQKTF